MNQSYQINRIFQNESWLVVEKPAGWLTIPARKVEGMQIKARPCLSEELRAQGENSLFTVHRLDSEVSGLLLFARTKDAHRRASLWFEGHLINKYYEAWTLRNPSIPFPYAEVEWRMYLAKGKRRSFEVNDAEVRKGKLAITRAKVLGEIKQFSADDVRYRRFLSSDQSALVWRLQPVTGKTHQLRVALAKNYSPILGDELYGFKSVSTTAQNSEPGIALRAMHLDFSLIPDAERLGLPPGLSL